MTPRPIRFPCRRDLLVSIFPPGLDFFLFPVGAPSLSQCKRCPCRRDLLVSISAARCRLQSPEHKGFKRREFCPTGEAHPSPIALRPGGLSYRQKSRLVGGTSLSRYGIASRPGGLSYRKASRSGAPTDTSLFYPIAGSGTATLSDL